MLGLAPIENPRTGDETGRGSQAAPHGMDELSKS